MKKLLVLLLSATILFSLVACGENTSATSGVSSTTNEVVLEKAEEPEASLPASEEIQLNNDSNEVETEIQEPEKSSTNAFWQIDYEDYFEGNTWDLTAYAEDLGYEWLPDPEFEGLIMYTTENNGIKYFFCFRRCAYYIFFYDGISCWRLIGDSSISLAFRECAISGKGQMTEDVPRELIERIAEVMVYLKSSDFDKTGVPGHYVADRYDNIIPTYCDNGMIRQREFGEVTESRFYTNF